MKKPTTSLLTAAISLLPWTAADYTDHRTNQSEVPLYGLSPPVYPTPIGNGRTSAAWSAAYEYALSLVSQMTLEEKSNMTRGFTGVCVGNTGTVTRLGIPALCFADAPDGIRGQEFVSAFPAGSHLGSTFDRDMMYRYGKAVGDEYYGKGINVALGPFVGPLGRVVRGGRRWEGLGSDPYLAGIGGGLITGGMQDAGVISTVKHFLLNEQEYRRMPDDLGESMSSNADDRTIHEFYAWPFYDSLKAGAGSVMCSYQRVNNSYSCQNSALLNGLLKTEMGFEGFVVSDWDAQHAGVATANSGMDVVMPDGGYWGQNLTAAVANGSVSTDRLDDMATRVLAAHYFTGQTKNFPAVEVFTYTEQHPIVDVRADHAKLIREIGAAGHVILKNVNGTLPFVKPRYLNIYGYDAEVKASPWENPSRYGGGYEVNWGWDTFNGTLITGGGSGSNSPPYVISPFKALQDRLIADNGILRWDFFSQDPIIYANADACLVFINSYASESFDRLSLTDDWSDQLVLNVAAGCSNTVVVLHSAGVRTVEAWIDHSNVTAVVFAGLPGQESGYSLVDVLYGEVNATGRLPFTVAHNESDYGEALNSTVDFSAFPQSNFTEGLYVDYRHFDAKNITPRFEFGYGLTYTTFEYSDFVVNAVNGTSTATYPAANISIVQGGHPQLWDILYVLHANVTNTGSRAGAEIAQLYLGIPDSPAKQLRGFEKVVVDVGETKEAVFEVRRRDLSIWNTTAQDWELQSGEYQAWIGSSSRNLHLDLSFAI